MAQNTPEIIDRISPLYFDNQKSIGELLENAGDRRRGIRIHAQFLALVLLFGERFLLRHHGSYKAGRTRNYEDRQ